MHRVRMLKHFGVTPYIVFDGDYLPSKAATEKDRAMRRAESRRIGLDLLRAGKTTQALQELQKAVDVTPDMARQVIDELKKNGIQYVVAPYEADAQMAYLEREGIVDGVLSEDSDLLVFGTKCLLTKLDQYGNCVEINQRDFSACKEMSLTGWTDADFRVMAILSGCDYLASINGMGLKTAHRMVRKHKTIEKIVRMLQFDGKFHVPKDYLENFRQAEMTFLYQRVFCPRTRKLTFATTPDANIDTDQLHYIGAFVEESIAQGVACGDLNPNTKQRMASQTILATSTPRLAHNTQPLRSASTSDLKTGVPIGAFFKQQRIPLAELDPNCFTPSPSQQAALARNNGSWLAGQASRPYLQRTASDSSPSTSVRSSESSIPAAAEVRPMKRARLCADVESPLSALPSTATRSRFFSHASSIDSPSTSQRLTARRTQKAQITVFADNTECESSDCNDKNKSKIPEEIGDENSTMPTTAKLQEVKIEKLGRPDPLFLSQHRANVAASDCLTTKCSNRPLSKVSISESGSVTPGALGCSREKSSRLSLAPMTTPISGNLGALPPTPPWSKGAGPDTPPVSQSRTSTGITRSFGTKLTPLQRLGASATNRLQSLTPPLTPLSRTPANYQPGMYGKPFLGLQSMRNQKCDPANVPLPPVSDAEIAALSGARGSEDMIVHDSEEESPISPRHSPRASSGATDMDLKRFVFVR